MKVILLEDVKPLGKKGEIVDASDAYARNVLFSKKKAVEATDKNLNDLKLQNKHAKKVAEDNLDAARALAKKLEGLKVELKIRTGEGDKTFGSVSTKEIAAAAKSQLDLPLDKKKMQLEEPIRSLGMHEVPIRLHSEVTGMLRVHVSAE